MSALNDLRAILALKLLDWAMTVAPDDGMKVGVARALNQLSRADLERQTQKTPTGRS